MNGNMSTADPTATTGGATVTTQVTATAMEARVTAMLLPPAASPALRPPRRRFEMTMLP